MTVESQSGTRDWHSLAVGVVLASDWVSLFSRGVHILMAVLWPPKSSLTLSS